MLTIKRLSFVFLATLFCSCRLFQPTAYFFISNGSKDKTPVDIQVKIGGQIVLDDSIKYTNVRPDLQYTPSVTLTKGKYTIFVTADSGRTILTQPIMLDGDRWIFISYSYNSPADSVQREILKNNFGYDTSFINQKIRGTQSNVVIHIVDKEPIHM